MRKVNGMNIPEMPEEYEVWRDEHSRLHFRVRGSADDMFLQSWTWWELDDKDYGKVLIRRFDMINRQHRYGFCSPTHPLVLALGLEKP